MTVEIRPLREEDDRGSFKSGDQALDLFFHRYAGQNQFRHHIGVTYVACESDRIVGFVTVAAAVFDAEDLPSGKRMPPYPLPVLRVARLAVATDERGRGIGRALVRFACEVAERMRDDVGCVGVAVDAKPGATGFYESFGFVAVEAVAGQGRSRPGPTLMFLPIGAIPRRA